MSRSAPDRESLLAALDVAIERPSLSVPYRLGILLIALVLWLLPLIYVGLVVLVAYGLFFHATESLAMFESKGSMRGKVALYVIPLIVGGLLLLFMVKPLFARQQRRDDRLELDPDREPFVFEFVAAACRAVGAEPPRRILVDCDVNASAGFHQGGTGLTNAGRELTIGLPLVAGLPLRNLTGVLAHEFGHFSQGTGMRLSGLVVRVQAWFARVVYQRDEWDLRIERWSKSGWWYVMATGALARGFVWLTRKLLYGLMWVSNAVSAYMSRQMEYDADRYQIALAGSEVVGQTLRELTVLGLADQSARSRLGQSWQDRRLVDDLPGLVLQRRRSMPEDTVKSVQAMVDKEFAHRFATHPRTVDREAAALELDDPGKFTVEVPACVLFDDFEGLSREASEVHFRTAIGPAFAKASLVPVSEFVADVEETDERNRSVARYFQGVAGLMRGIAVPAEVPPPPTDPKSAGARIRELRQSLREQRDRLNELQAAWIAAYDRLSQLEFVDDLTKVKQKFKPKDFGLEKGDRESVKAALGEQRGTLRAAQEAYEGELVEVEERLAVALSMLRVPVIGERLDADEGVSGGATALLNELASLLPAVSAMQTTLATCSEIRSQLSVLSFLDRMVDDDADRKKYGPVIRGHASRLRNLCTLVQERLGEVAYPFPHATPGITLADWAFPKLSMDTHWADLYQEAGGGQDRLGDGYFRGLARVTWIAERIEAALGMEPMPVPLHQSAG